jgi:pyrimidine deaminase RibD-like protein
MPLTSTPLLLDDYERNRKIAERLAAGGQQSARMGIDALATMEQLAKQGRAEARQKGLDEQAANTLVLERKDKDAANARGAAEAARAAEMHKLNVPILQRKAAREEEEHEANKLVLQRKNAESALKSFVTEGLRDAVPAEELALRAVDLDALGPMSPSDLAAEYEAQQRAQSDRANKNARDEAEQTRKEKDSAAGRARDYAAAKAATTKQTDKATAADDKGADALRKEMNALPAVKEFAEVDVAFQRMKRAAAAPSPAGDLTLVYSFMKMQDPSSTVRESEFASAAKAGTFGDQMQAQVERITSGELLTPQQRQDLLKQAEVSYRTRKGAADAAGGRYRGIAERRGLNVNDVVASDVPDDDRW